MSGVLCDHCNGYFNTSAHLCGEKLSRSLEERVLLHETTQKELALAQQGIASAVQDIKRLEAEVEKLNLELMERDTRPDFERGEYAGQDAMMRHIPKLTEGNNSALAEAVRNCPLVQVRGNVLDEVSEYLEYAGYKVGSAFDPEAAKAFHGELSIIQARAKVFAIERKEEPWPPSSEPKQT